MNSKRVYTDQEVAVILRKATEMQRDRGAPADGLTLSALREIAREIGLDPNLVSDAARQLPSSAEGVLARFFGGGTRQDIQIAHDRPLSAAQLRELAMTIRTAMQHQGQMQEVLGSLEWKTVGEVSQVAVTTSAHDGGTDVHIIVDRGGAALLTGAGAIGLGVVGALITGAILEPGVAGGVSLVAGGLTAGIVMARAIWRRNSRRFREKLARLTESIERTLQ